MYLLPASSSSRVLRGSQSLLLLGFSFPGVLFLRQQTMDAEIEALLPEIRRLLADSLSSDQAFISAASDGLDRLLRLPCFPFALLSIASSSGSEDQCLRIATATHLKAIARRNLKEVPFSPELHVEFRNQLVRTLLIADHAVLKILVDVLRMIITVDFVKENSWPQLVLDLKSAIQNSTLLSRNANSQWKSFNALTVLQTFVRPFQYFLNPKISREPVLPLLELIAVEIIVPLLDSFHHVVVEDSSFQGSLREEKEQTLLIICKTMYFTVRSYMPSALSAKLPSFCLDLCCILDSLNLDGASGEAGYLMRLKTVKRSLMIFLVLVTRHRKQIDKLLLGLLNCTFRISKESFKLSKLDYLSERIISLALDVISHVLETGPGWRLISPHFSSLLVSAIFPALAMNEKDMREWEEDPEEYMRKNLPSELDEISGFAEELFTARKSAVNLLGVIAMSKGIHVGTTASKRKKSDKNKGKGNQSSVGELIVIPFLSKFPMPSDGMEVSSRTAIDYYGVLMAYGGLQDFLRERNPEYTSILVRSRVLPIYSVYPCQPYLVATANWILGQLAPCLPQAMNTDIYLALTKALSTSGMEDTNYYPVLASAAGAIVELVENDYFPCDWQSLLQIIIARIGVGHEDESSLLLQLLGNLVEAGQDKIITHLPFLVSKIADAVSKHVPPFPEHWPQIVERGFAVLATMATLWEDSKDDVCKEENERKSAWFTIACTYSHLLQHVWLCPIQQMDGRSISSALPPACVDDCSALLGSIMRFATTVDEVVKLKIIELLEVWAKMIAEWDQWEDTEDLAIFSAIQEAVNLQSRFDQANFLTRTLPQDFSGKSSFSIMQGISDFVCKGIAAYPSAARRACSCVHLLLHTPLFSSLEMEAALARQSMAVSFTRAAFSRLMEARDDDEDGGIWKKPFLLVISSSYMSYPDVVAQDLERHSESGFAVWLQELARISSSSFEPGLSSESEIKLSVLTLTKAIERFIEVNPSSEESEFLRCCFISLMEAYIRLQQVQEGGSNATEEDEDEDDETQDDDEEDDEDSDNDDDVLEETEEEFLDRYAKAAEELESGGLTVSEGDDEGGDEPEELELGTLDAMDIAQTVLSLITRYHQVLVRRQQLPSSLLQHIDTDLPAEFGSIFQ